MPAGLRGDRVDDRRPDRPRHPRAAGLGGRDRRRPEGQGPRAAGLQDRQDRLEGSCGAQPARPGAGDLAARSQRSARSASSPASGLHLVKHSSALKHRIHSTLINFGKPCPVTDLFGVEGRKLLEATRGPRALAGEHHRLDRADRRPRGARSPRSTAACKAGPRRAPLRPAALDGARGSAGSLPSRSPPRSARSSASPSPEKLTGYTGLCPRVIQSGESDRRGPLTKHGPDLPALGAARGDDARASATPPTPSATSEPSAGSESSAAPRSPRSTSPAGSPTRSGTCLPATRSSLPEAPLFVWRPDRPFGLAPERTSNFA